MVWFTKVYIIVILTLVQQVIYINSTNTCQKPQRKLDVLEFLPKTPYSLSISWFFRATLLRKNYLAKRGSENSSDSKSLKCR